MSRLIDADELRNRIPITHADEFENCRNCSLLCDWEVEDLVDDAPIIDAVEVIRCKDCKYIQRDTLFGQYWCNGRKVTAEGYCADGESDD